MLTINIFAPFSLSHADGGFFLVFSSRKISSRRHFVFVVMAKVSYLFPRFSVLFLLYFPMAAIGYGVLGSEAGSNIIYSLAPGPAKVKRTRITLIKMKI
jgi:hypothetical protein